MASALILMYIQGYVMREKRNRGDQDDIPMPLDLIYNAGRLSKSTLLSRNTDWVLGCIRMEQQRTKTRRFHPYSGFTGGK